MSMDYSTFGSLMTVVMLVVFLAIVAWACSSKRSAQFDAAARVPFEEDAESAPKDAS
jgi:cytochrome c oxidase cbb3-type subunit 4